ncbi:MAG: hypothetical protein GX456_00240 [Verrucomicrobia bacterium]|nr:hypothetical protein [Verrucomicrobiota bacterium]
MARKTSANVSTWVYRHPSIYQYNRVYLGAVASPPGAMLFRDGDDGFRGTRNNIPDLIDNHCAAGGQASFAAEERRVCSHSSIPWMRVWTPTRPGIATNNLQLQ